MRWKRSAGSFSSVHHDVGDPLRDALVGRALDRRDRVLGEVLREDRHRRRSVEGKLPRERAIHDGAERIDVAPRVDLFALHLLGRHEIGRTDDRSLARELVELRTFTELREAEVEDLREVGIVARPRDHDVLGLDVAVDDALQVRLRERVAHLDHDARELDRAERIARAKDATEIAAGHELHDEVGETVGDAVVEDLHRVRRR